MRIFRRYKLFMEKMENLARQRELVGVDKYGNKYYQYYSYYGLPHRREVEYVQKQRLNYFEDLAFYFWLRKREDLPPSEDYLKDYYLDEDKRRKLALEWDLKEEQLSLEYRQQKEKEKQQKLLESQVEVDTWKPKQSNIRKRKINKD